MNSPIAKRDCDSASCSSALEEIQTLLAILPESVATAFAVAAFMGLRAGEIRGLEWPDWRDGEIHVRRSIWKRHVLDPKTTRSRSSVPVIRQLADRLEMHRLRDENPADGPIFRNSRGMPLAFSSIVTRVILPAVNRCEVCGRSERDHGQTKTADHEYRRDCRIPEWHGWHAARRGLGSNLNRLGVDDSAHPAALEHLDHTGVLHQDFREGCSKGHDDARNQHPRGAFDWLGHRQDTVRCF